MNSKLNTICILSTGLLLLCPAAKASNRKISKVEVPLQQVFIPNQGYDDNDNVEAVLIGELPNPCFTLADSTVEKMGTGFRVRQFAWLSEEGPCGSGDLIDDPVSFTSTVSLGMLTAAKYPIEFDRENASKGIRNFEVEKASTDSLDNFDYVALSNIEMKDEFYAPEAPTAVLTGFLPSSCAKLGELSVQRQKDVIVVLPIVETSDGPGCTKKKVPFRRTIQLGKLALGDYLLHVRGRNGKAQYHAFHMWKH